MCGFMVDHVDMKKLSDKQKDSLKKELVRRRGAVEKQIDAHQAMIDEHKTHVDQHKARVKDIQKAIKAVR
jgi:lipopolysaccharide biosynthesis regulator YciM